jgi:hypothetical protein
MKHFLLPRPPATGQFRAEFAVGFGALQADLALQRQFYLTEKMNVRFLT